MKRWQVTYLGKPFMLYGDSVEEVKQKYSSTIDKGSDIIPLPYPQELFDRLTELPVRCRDKTGREYREVNLGCNYCTYRVSKDETDGKYYDLVQYRINGGRLIAPALWSTCTAQEFVDMYLKPVPEKKCGLLFSLKEVKKLCGKVQFKIGKVNVWKDSDGYYYIGFQNNWSKIKKEEYKVMSKHRESAIYVSFTDGLFGGHKYQWFESEDAWHEYWKKTKSEQPSYARTLDYEIIKHGYNKLPIEDRKLICRLRYMNLERELKTEPSDIVAQWWAKYNRQFVDDKRLFEKIAEKVKEQRNGKEEKEHCKEICGIYKNDTLMRDFCDGYDNYKQWAECSSL